MRWNVIYFNAATVFPTESKLVLPWKHIFVDFKSCLAAGIASSYSPNVIQVWIFTVEAIMGIMDVILIAMTIIPVIESLDVVGVCWIHWSCLTTILLIRRGGRYRLTVCIRISLYLQVLLVLPGRILGGDICASTPFESIAALSALSIVISMAVSATSSASFVGLAM